VSITRSLTRAINSCRTAVNDSFLKIWERLRLQPATLRLDSIIGFLVAGVEEVAICHSLGFVEEVRMSKYQINEQPVK